MIKFHTDVKYDSILDNFSFRYHRANVKVAVADLKKTFSLFWSPNL